MSENELLSVNDIARLWGTGTDVVVQLVSSGELSSLDRGLLVAEGRYDVPVIRRSWAEALRNDSPGAGRILDSPAEDVFHPAFETAFEFHSALAEYDAEALYKLSSRQSRKGRDPDELLDVWVEVGSRMLEPRAGVGTAIYSLAPLDAAAARVLDQAPSVPRAVTKATPATLLGVLPLIEEEGSWRVDLPLFEKREEWHHLLTEPLPVPSSVPGSESSS